MHLIYFLFILQRIEDVQINGICFGKNSVISWNDNHRFRWGKKGRNLSI